MSDVVAKGAHAPDHAPGSSMAALDDKYVPSQVGQTHHAPGLGLWFPEAEGAVGDGTTNDSAALAAAITAANTAGGGTVMGRGPGHVYGLASSVVMKSNVRLVNCWIKDTVGNSVLIDLSTATDVEVSDCHFTGSGTVGTAGRAAIWGNPGGATRVKILNNTIDTVGTTGIALTAMTDVIITGNIIRRPAEHGIYISTSCADVTIANNIILGVGYGGSVSSAIHVKLARCNDVLVDGNYLDGTDGANNYGILFEFGSLDCSATNNVVKAMTLEGIRVDDASSPYAAATNIRVENNKIEDCTSQSCRCFGGSNVSFVGNIVRGTAQSFLVASTTTNVQIIGNIIKQTGGLLSIDVTAAGAIIKDNISLSTSVSDDAGISIRSGTTSAIASGNRTPAFTNSAGSGCVVINKVGTAVAASTLGTLSKKLTVFDDAGAVVGYLPVYTTIT